MAFTVVVISVPFVMSGVCVSLALTQFGRNVSGLYAADLTGAALGCLLVLALLRVTDAPTAVIFIATVAACGAVAFAIDAGRRRLTTLSVITALALLIGSGRTHGARLARVSRSAHPVHQRIVRSTSAL
jgi:hypothetical protein